MSENEYTPKTQYVRAVYAEYQDTYRDLIDPDYGTEFDRWLAKHDLETFDRGWVAGAEEVLRGMWPAH
jgi:hypothetical protein